jgi:hypothetical protein
VRLKDDHPVLKATSKWRAFWTAPVIFAGALLSVVVSWLSVDFFGRALWTDSLRRLVLPSLAGHALGIAFLGLTGSVVVGSVAGAFRRGDRRALVTTVLTSYFSLMLVFASMFFEAAFFGDLQDAIFKYERYRADALAHVDGPLYESRRAFTGIERRFWSGVDWPVRAGTFPGGLPPGSYRVSVAQMRQTAASRTENDVIQYIPEARLAIFGDCLHLSIVTMTTVGYGDIAPRSLAARFASDIEAICNTLLLIFGLGMIFGDWRAARRAKIE